ncbi:hypothetical protein Tco_0376126 [Tanacetum coccineum]
MVAPLRIENVQRNVLSGLESSWGDWNARLNEIERREAWRDSMLLRTSYQLYYSISLLHHLAEEFGYTDFGTRSGSSMVPSLGYEVG